jgi:hypothetical protein
LNALLRECTVPKLISRSLRTSRRNRFQRRRTEHTSEIRLPVHTPGHSVSRPTLELLPLRFQLTNQPPKRIRPAIRWVADCRYDSNLRTASEAHTPGHSVGRRRSSFSKTHCNMPSCNNHAMPTPTQDALQHGLAGAYKVTATSELAHARQVPEKRKHPPRLHATQFDETA